MCRNFVLLKPFRSLPFPLPPYGVGGFPRPIILSIVALAITLQKRTVLLVETKLIWNCLKPVAIQHSAFQAVGQLFPLPAVWVFFLSPCGVGGGDKHHRCYCWHLWYLQHQKAMTDAWVVTRTPTFLEAVGTYKICNTTKKMTVARIATQTPILLVTAGILRSATSKKR